LFTPQNFSQKKIRVSAFNVIRESGIRIQDSADGRFFLLCEPDTSTTEQMPAWERYYAKLPERLLAGGNIRFETIMNEVKRVCKEINGS